MLFILQHGGVINFGPSPSIIAPFFPPLRSPHHTAIYSPSKTASIMSGAQIILTFPYPPLPFPSILSRSLDKGRYFLTSQHDAGHTISIYYSANGYFTPFPLATSRSGIVYCTAMFLPALLFPPPFFAVHNSAAVYFIIFMLQGLGGLSLAGRYGLRLGTNGS